MGAGEENQTSLSFVTYKFPANCSPGIMDKNESKAKYF